MLYGDYLRSRMRHTGSIKEISGVPPLTLLKSAGKPLKDYKIYGKSTQNGTPAPSAPVEVKCVGDLVTDTSSEYYGKYNIPVMCSNRSDIPLVDLPQEYQQVEWIGSTGTQFIDTGYRANIYDITVKCKASVTRQSGSHLLFGVYSAPFAISLNIYGTGSLSYAYYNSVSEKATTSNIASDTAFDMEFSSEGLKIDNVNVASWSRVASQQTYSNYIFAANNAGNPRFKVSAKVFSFSFLKNGVVQLNLIPCYRISDGVIGMYDTVSKTFLTNAGAGTFTKGENVYNVTTNIYLDEQLRGIGSALDDICFNTGKRTNAIGEVDMGDLDWLYQPSSYKNFVANIEGCKTYASDVVPNIKTERYAVYSYDDSPPQDKVLFAGVNIPYVYINDLDYSDVESFKTAMSGKKIYFEKDAQTEESIVLPTVLTQKGTNIVAIGTTVNPSSMSCKYQSK